MAISSVRVVLLTTTIIFFVEHPIWSTCMAKHDVGSNSISSSNTSSNTSSGSTGFDLSAKIGAPNCYAEMKVKPNIACRNGSNFFQINSSLSKGDDEEVAIKCSADYPIDLKFDGLFNRHPSLKIVFDRQINSVGKQEFFLNFSFPAEVVSTGDYIIYSGHNLSLETTIEMKLTPKHSAGQDQINGGITNIINPRPILANVTDKLLTLEARVNEDNKRLFMVCASEFESNVQRLVNVYANNPTEATYKSECLFKNYRCFSKREGSLVRCGTYGLSNYSCRSVDLKPPGGFVSCFTEGYDVNYSITKKYFVGVDNQYYFKEEGDDIDTLSSEKVISITKAEYNPWSGQPYEFSCKMSTYLLARKISWYLVHQNSWKLLTNDHLTEDKKSATVTSRVNIVFNSSANTNKASVVCIGYHYKSAHTFNSTVDINIIESFAPIFYNSNKEVKEFDGQGYFILECKAFGIPPPKLEWVKDGINISSANVETVTGLNYTHSILKFPKINKDTPIGDVKCMATNRLDCATKDFVTRIKDDPSNGLYWKLLGISLGISIAASFILIFLYIHFKRKTAALTKAEIDAFKKGNPHPIDPDQANAIPQNIPYNEEYEVNEKNLLFDEANPESILGSGAFGLVLKGIYNDQPVAIKTLKPHSSKSELQSLLCELKVMQYIGEHKSIAKLIGASTKNLHLGKALVILELYSLGSLENYLKKFRGSFVNELYSNELSSPTAASGYKNIAYLTQGVIFTRDLINWSCQIADGMAYLSEISVIHGDLATRNILLADKNTIKIADFGLSRKQYANFYAKQSHEPVPWRWMALESLRYLIFSSETDVWSYGIMLWEIFTLAEVPYSGLGWSEEFKDSLARGMRLPRPVYAPQQLYDVMFECWQEEPKLRIKFDKIKHCLQTIHSKLVNTSGLLGYTNPAEVEV